MAKMWIDSNGFDAVTDRDTYVAIVEYGPILPDPDPYEVDILSPPGTRAHRVHGIVTTDHAAASYGLPVVILGGRAYGPADLGPHEITLLTPVDVDGWIATDDDVAATDRMADHARRAGYTVGRSDHYLTCAASEVGS